MKLNLFSKTKLNLLVIVILSMLTSVSAQQVSLSLADILTALRSKKATPDEKNKLLTDAVRQRGITFPLTAEIEKELMTTGADINLVQAIRQKSPIIKVSATPAPTPKPVATPLPTPPPPDYTFYQNRGNANFVKGELDLAINDYNKSIELNPKDVANYLSRAMAYVNKKSFESAIADYSKAVELSPKDAKLYFKRGETHEKTGELEKAFEDYKKAAELDANNEPAKTSAQRLQLEIDKKIAAQKEAEEKALAAKSAPPPILNLGQLNAQAVNLVKPTYPPLAHKMGVQGKVVVQVTIDEKGKVISAKAIEGNTALREVSETAVRRSTFKPALWNEQPVKATGTVTYNFRPN